MHSSRRKLAYLFACLPAGSVLLITLAGPLGLAVHETFFPRGCLDLAALHRALENPMFGSALLWNVVIPVGSLVVEGAVGLGMALLFHQMRLGRGKVLWTVVALLPFAVPEIVYLLTMKLLLREHGYVNSVLDRIGLDSIGWIEPGSWMGPISVVLVDAWRVTPIVFLVCLAGLERIPESCVQAAVVDGASSWQLVRWVLVPLVLPSFLIALALRAVDAFRIFATPLLLTGVDGLPVLSSLAYHLATDRNDPAAANVPALILTLLLTVAVGPALLVWKRAETDR